MDMDELALQELWPYIVGYLAMLISEDNDTQLLVTEPEYLYQFFTMSWNTDCIQLRSYKLL